MQLIAFDSAPAPAVPIDPSPVLWLNFGKY